MTSRSSVCDGSLGVLLCGLLVFALPGCGGEGAGEQSVAPVGEELGAMQEQMERGAHVSPDVGGAETPAAEPGSPAPRQEDEAAVGSGPNTSSEDTTEPGDDDDAPPSADDGTEATDDGAEQAESQPPVPSDSEGPGSDKLEPTAPSESESPTASEPETPPKAPDDTAPEGPSFAAVFEQVFEGQGCTAGYCHGGGAGELSFADAVMTYDTLVDGMASKESCGLTTWVVPGDPEASILWYRVRPLELEEGTPCVSKMPNGSDGLPAEQAQLIYDWILGGALP